MSPLAVSDILSNRNDQLVNAAEAIGRSAARRRVFDAVYRGKRTVKTVREIAASTGLTEKQVLTAGKPLASTNLFEQIRVDQLTAYRKYTDIALHKKRILGLSRSKKQRDQVPTKTRPVSKTPLMRIPRERIDIVQITVDDIDSFFRVRRILHPPAPKVGLSERQFKEGIKTILGELGAFPDWGGEHNDMYTTRLRLGGRRRAAAFALKGPGLRGKLTPARMGKNGDQVMRLFQSEGEVFIVQHSEQIDETIVALMRQSAAMKSIATGQRIYFGVIDGADSARLIAAHTRAFASGSTRPAGTPRRTASSGFSVRR